MARSPVINLNLRLPPDLHKALVEYADRQKPKLSLNTVIVSLLYLHLARATILEVEKISPEKAQEAALDLARQLIELKDRVLPPEQGAGE